MLNQCIFQGRITDKPNYKLADTVKVAHFRLAVQRDFKDKDGKIKADYINCSAFGKNAEIADKYCQKGQMIIVKGSFHNGKPFDDSEGIRRYPSFLNVDKIYFTSFPKNNSEQKDEEENVNFVQMGDIPF